jgi:hypothetical protein
MGIPPEKLAIHSAKRSIEENPEYSKTPEIINHLQHGFRHFSEKQSLPGGFAA